jgi:hypothetical protein
MPVTEIAACILGDLNEALSPKAPVGRPPQAKIVG